MPTGPLLPALEDIDTDDNAELAEIKTTLSEMAKTKAELDELLRRPEDRNVVLEVRK